VNCRFCAKPLEHSFLDLGFAPPSNAYLTEADLQAPERYFPLRLYVCDGCWLVQTQDYARPDELFRPDYAYFTSTARSALDHAAAYCTMVRDRFRLDGNSFVVEVGSNDGYLLRNFVRDGVSCLGIEPTASTAAAAEAIGVPVLREFFGDAVGRRLADEGRRADLLIGNNIYAHVPDINDFTAGLREALKPCGTITLEFPHLLRLMEETQFDTVYHEHFSYLSLWTAQRIFASCGLRVWDAEQLATHGGSLRVYGCHAADPRPESSAVLGVLQEEESAGLRGLEIYRGFQARVDKVKNDLLAFLIEQKRAGKSVAAYGAAAKGNTLLNYAGVKPDLVPFVCDAAPSKQGKYLPGSHIPILAPRALQEQRPNWVLVLPWNIINEVTEQQRHIRNWGGRFVVAVPRLELLS
jgi:SAM-dependent methyltransferase